MSKRIDFYVSDDHIQVCIEDQPVFSFTSRHKDKLDFVDVWITQLIIKSILGVGNGNQHKF